MSNLDHLVEQQFIEHESRLKHIDELLDYAHSHASVRDVAVEAQQELEDIKNLRAELKESLDHMRLDSVQEWENETVRRAGPLGIWDAVAQRLEKLVEHLDKH